MVSSWGGRQVRLDKREGFFFSFDLEEAILGTLAGGKVNQGLGFREEIPHAFLFPGPATLNPSRKRMNRFPSRPFTAFLNRA